VIDISVQHLALLSEIDELPYWNLIVTLNMFGITYSTHFCSSKITDMADIRHYLNYNSNKPQFMVITDIDSIVIGADMTVIRIYDDITLEHLVGLMKKYRKLRAFV
jgi:hypothetical protein